MPLIRKFGLPNSRLTAMSPKGGGFIASRTAGNPGFVTDMGLGTGLNPTGDVTADVGGQLAKPPAGELTFRQAIGSAGVGFAQVPGFAMPSPATYQLYRRIGCHPTVGLARSVVTAPILASAWSYEVRRPDGRPTRKGPRIGDGVTTDPIDKQLAARAASIQHQLDPLRSTFLWEAVRALDTGWRPFEKIWDIDQGEYRLKRLKPLLPDITWIYVDRFGNFAGLTQMDSTTGPAKSMVYTYDGEAGNFYGRSRHLSALEAWHKWHQVDDRAAQLATKSAAIIPMIHYPIGKGQNINGQEVDNFDNAQTMLNALGRGVGIALPNLYHNSEDARTQADLAGKSPWIVSFLEATAAAGNLAGMTERQRYYDALMVRAWLRSERAVIEATNAGSRADSEQHSDTGLTDSELVHGNLCEQLSVQVVDQILELNEGPEAVGSVYITPAPIQGAKKALLGQLFAAIWANPQGLPEFIKNADMDSIYDLMEIPKANEQVKFELPMPPTAPDTGKPTEPPKPGENLNGDANRMTAVADKSDN